MNDDIIFIKGLELQTIIGTLDFERHTPQRVVLDIEMHVNIDAAAQTDNLCATVNYAAVVECVTQWAQEAPELVETLGVRIAQGILAQFAVKKVKVRVCKPDILPQCAGVGVVIVREA